MRILVTGGSGFIGRHLAAGLAAAHSVRAPGRAELDLLDAAAVRSYLEGQSFDAVLHAATWDATPTSQKDRSRVLDHNLRMFANLFRERLHFGRLIHFGSGAEYGRSSWHAGMREEEADGVVPEDDYGLSKGAIHALARESGQVLNLRLFAVFGPGEDWRTRFISSNICRALLGLPLVIRQDREFDFLHVDDVVRAVASVLAGPTTTGSLNLCRGQGVALTAIARSILEAVGCQLPVEIRLPGLGPAYSGDNRRFLERYPWQPGSLDGAIRIQVEWLKTRVDELDPAALVVPA